MTTSPNLGITHIAASQNQKEVTANAAFDALDAAITETISVSVASGSVTVTSPQAQDAICIKATGATVAGRTVTLPAVKRMLVVEADAANTVPVAFVRGSTSIPVAPGFSVPVYVDGSANGIKAIVGTAAVGRRLEWFGDGSDGVVTITGAVTLTRDMFYDRLILNSAAAIQTNGFRIYVKNDLDLTAAPAGAIQRNGFTNFGNGSAAGTGGTNASVRPGDTIGGSSAGANGGAGGIAAGTAGGASTAQNCMGGSSGTAGAGGSGSGGAGGASGANGTFSPRTTRIPAHTFWRSSTYLTGGASGGGGGGGGGDGTSGAGGGGSGNGGAIVFVAARQINRGSGTGVGAIAAIGSGSGNGGSATAGNRGGGGGAAGAGGGGIVILFEELLGSTATGAMDVSGGAGGSGGNGFGTGRGGQGGSGGLAGRVLKFDLLGGVVIDSTDATVPATPAIPVTTAGSAGTAGVTWRVDL